MFDDVDDAECTIRETADGDILVFTIPPDPILATIPANAKVISTRPFSFEEEFGDDLEELAAIARSGGFYGCDLHFPNALLEMRWVPVSFTAIDATSH